MTTLIANSSHYSLATSEKRPPHRLSFPHFLPFFFSFAVHILFIYSCDNQHPLTACPCSLPANRGTMRQSYICQRTTTSATLSLCSREQNTAVCVCRWQHTGYVCISRCVPLPGSAAYIYIYRYISINVVDFTRFHFPLKHHHRHPVHVVPQRLQGVSFSLASVAPSSFVSPRHAPGLPLRHHPHHAPRVPSPSAAPP